MKRDSIKIKEIKILSRRKFNFSGRLLEPMAKGARRRIVAEDTKPVLGNHFG
ncbi:hypothetical protein PGB90_003592 [Kerria lacca]